jgi:hypothetical protein
LPPQVQVESRMEPLSSTIADINARNRAFWNRESAEAERRMADPCVLHRAIADIEAEARRLIPVKSQRSFELALQDAEALVHDPALLKQAHRQLARLHDLLAWLRFSISGASRVCRGYLDRLPSLFGSAKLVGGADLIPAAIAATEDADAAAREATAPISFEPDGAVEGKRQFRPTAFAPAGGLDGDWVRSQSRPAATMPYQFDRHATEEALRAACHKLPKRHDSATNVETAVSRLVTLAQALRNRPPASETAFSIASKSTCDTELRALSRHASALAEVLENLHQPTILALADDGFDSSFRTDLPAILRRMVLRADRATIPDQPPNAGRGAKRRQEPYVIARLAGSIYRDITGRIPTFTTYPITSAVSGLWPTFLKDVLSAIGVDGYGDRLMRTVAKEMKSRK